MEFRGVGSLARYQDLPVIRYYIVSQNPRTVMMHHYQQMQPWRVSINICIIIYM